MEKTYFPRKFRVYLPLLALLALLVFLKPRVSKFNYDYKKGDTWMYETLVSQFDFPILKTERQLADDIERVSSSVVPYYRRDAAVFRRCISSLEKMQLGALEPFRPRIASELTEIYSKGVLAASPIQKDSSVTRLLLVQRDRQTMKVPVDEVYTLQEAQSRLYNSIGQTTGRSDLDSLIAASGLSELI